MTNLRIALVAPGFSAGPADWAIPALLDLARALATRLDLHVFSQRYPARGVYQFDGLTHHARGGGQRFGPASINIWLQTSRAIIERHRKTPFDLIHAFWADEAGFVAVLAGIRLKRPVIVSLGGGELTRLPDINYGAQRFLVRRLTTRYALNRATFVTAGSPYQHDLCRRHGVSQQKLRLASLGVDTQRFRPTAPEREEQSAPCPPAPRPAAQPTLIQTASLLPVKNQALLLDILHRVKKTLPTITLHLVGDGPEGEALAQRAGRLAVQPNIVWRGRIPYPETPCAYRQSHLYLQTSRHESQGMAVLEAMACGLPVLGTPVGVVREVACLPATFSPEVLAGQVIEVFGDTAAYREFCRQARHIAVDKFSLPVTTETFLKIYEESLDNRSPPS